MRNFQDSFEILKPSFISVFAAFMTVPLIAKTYGYLADNSDKHKREKSTKKMCHTKEN